MKRCFRELTRLVFFMGILVWTGLPIFLPSAAFGMETREVGVVHVKALNMRTGPELSHPVLKVLPMDARVQVLGHTGDWLKVYYDGDIGYISGSREFVRVYTIHTVTGDRRTDLENARRKVRRIEKEIREKESDVSVSSRRERRVVSRLQKIDAQLNRTRREAADLKMEMAKVSSKIADLEGKAVRIQKKIDAGRKYAVRRLTALYKLNMLGEMNLLASAGSLTDLLKQKAALERILAGDYRLISDLVARKEDLSGALDQLDTERAEKQDLQDTYAATITRLEAEKQERQTVLSQIKSRKSNRMATIHYLRQAASRLDRTISRLGAPEPEIGNKTSFAAYQGLLKMPVNGKIHFCYGKYVEPQSGVTNFHNGIEIQAKRGAPIRAVYSGQLVYSSWLKGYGNVIIIAHGDNYYTVYAHADELFRKKGDHVEAGEVIATVGDTGSLDGACLYFEIRHYGNPVNPLKWINNS